MTTTSLPFPPLPAFDRTRYDADGWDVVEGFFLPDECAAIAGACAAREHPRVPPALVARLTDPRWAGVVLPLLGPGVRFFREQLVTKAPGSDAVVPWHQDHAFAPLGPPGLVTTFLALEPIGPDDGCLHVQPGGHRDGVLDHRRAGDILELVDPPAGDGHPVVLAQGSLLVFSSLLPHASGPNRGRGHRPVWIVQFCAADARERDGAPVRGRPLVAADGAWLDRPRP